ncbi:hypothetical protein ACTXJY_00325 [Corynebacterium casei]|uniref:hypothetical protein n=1 Tax=Corynebacterium casei TaxID=160386 RepID=UPI003FD627F9
MSWISKNLALDLIAIAIGGMQNAFDRIKSEHESDWPPTEVPAAQPHAVEPAPAPVEQAPAAAPMAQPTPTEMHTTAQPQAQPAEQPPAPAAQTPAEPVVNRLDEAKAHLRDISLAGGMDWITGTLFPSFGVTILTDVPAERLPELIQAATAYKLEKGLG